MTIRSSCCSAISSRRASARSRARGVLIDVTALDVLDSFATRTLRSASPMTAKLRGAQTVIVGIQPEVAFAMVDFGLSLEGVSTALDLEAGPLVSLPSPRREQKGVSG